MEYWDIYDADRNLTGRKMKRNDWNMAPGDYHLTVLSIVTDQKGKFLITKRAADKQWAPGSWEVSGGGVRAGEHSQDAAVREAQEETGLDLGDAEVTLADTYRSDSPEEKNNYFVDIYHISAEFDRADVHPQESETQGFALVDLDTIKKYGEKGDFLHYKRLLPSFEKIKKDLTSKGIV